MESERFITAFTSSCHLSLPWAGSIQSMSPLFLMIHFNIILPSTPVFQVVSFPSGFPTKPLYTSLPIHATCPALLILLALNNRMILCEYTLLNKNTNITENMELVRPSGLGDVQLLMYWQALQLPSSGWIKLWMSHAGGYTNLAVGGLSRPVGMIGYSPTHHPSPPPRHRHSKLPPPSNPQLYSPCRWQTQRLSKVDNHSSIRTNVLNSSRESLRARIICYEVMW